MAFSSVTFLFYFLPLFLIIYFITPGIRAKNTVLLIFSLVFYGWGGLSNLIVLGCSILGNFLLALWIDRREPHAKFISLIVAVSANLAGLIVFKYIGFFAQNLNVVLAPLNLAVPVPHLELPLGISFFTFHAISYLVDIYRGKARANPRLEEIAVYLTMFPQLVAGPIVRYSTINSRLRERRTTLGRVSAGLRIFIIGLSWKVLIADAVAPLAEQVFDKISSPNLAEAWIGVLSYTLQIYFDFGGYTNMAIGLALAMGLNFPRNFRLPYSARSVGDFWRRWHMSLSSWFRDYLYIPLGGNRRGHLHTALNLWTVFLLCGLWHGASWNFVIWGIHHGTFLVLERTRFGKWLAALPRPLPNLYTLAVVITGWVWFRADSLEGAEQMFRGMIGLNGGLELGTATIAALQPATILVFIIAWPLAIWGIPSIGKGWLSVTTRRRIYAPLDALGALFFFILSIVTVAASAYSPFLYFRF
ncbi:MBOAT family protein [Kaistia dalseonensis]|uniref:Probable alginate O-acetylase AlgI n=1 Tax=Kaistia dalseonensis TaxID=410840 RepID=A0ABU0HBX5_9HYPH|nr:MBOAT family O-acyltransferase [Kaistia dalseonensis]MCX5497175.1 MBOAT family protein [Kaistia dalseonensis]MDQ0439806.1 D-alanyl-lipoteichoic acid acyltransferase DltB (MBOAT superfamily) [Kaistia dalseonensis]